jgi:hypothetical protein
VNSPELTAADIRGTVWRVGFSPEPWAWSGWEWATDGRFPGRWDDLNGNFRTVYAGSSLLGCLLEVLAGFRKDTRLGLELADIDEDDEDKVLHPSLAPGLVPREWLDERLAASADLAGTFCAVTSSGSVATLYPRFIGMALSLNLADFDAAALKDARPRLLTQAIAAYIYDTGEFDGIQFASRHGDDLLLWAVFEQPGDGAVSSRITNITAYDLDVNSREILEAFRILDLEWEEE